MSTHFICSQCRMILSESERRSHISAEHLDYFPFGCPFCKKANKKHLETTKDDMDEHIATYHNGNNLGVLLLDDKAKEIELNRMIDQCQDFKQLNGARTSAGNRNTAQNASGSAQVKDEIGSDDDVIIIEDDSETAGMPNNPSGGNLPEQPTQEPQNFTESYPEMDFSSQSTSGIKRELPDNFSDSDSLESAEKRRLVLNDEQLESDNVERPTTSSHVTSSIPAYSSCKHVITKLYIVISEGIVCFETIDRCKRDYAPLSQHLPFLLDSVISMNHDIAIQFYASDCAIPYQYRKTIDDPVKEFTSLDQLKIFADQMHQISFLWSRCLISAYFGQFKSDNTPSKSDYCTLLFGPERFILKCKGLYVTIFQNWALNPLNIITNVQRDNYFIDRPTNSAQVTEFCTSVPPDSSCKHVITKLFIVISEGIVCFETIDRRTFKYPLYPYAPLSDYLQFLLESRLAYACKVAIQFYASDEAIPYEYRKPSDKPVKEFTSLGQLKTFAEQIRSIAYLWSHFPISAYFGQYKQKSNTTLSQSDYCTELFSGEQSILKCNEFDVTFFDFWPLSIVTNVVDKCRRCELNSEEAFPGNRHLYDEFLDEMYGDEVLRRIRDISLRIPIEAAANDFIEKLKERFQASPHKRFKFALYSPMEIHKLYLLNDTLKTKVIVKQKRPFKLFSNCVTIEQRSFRS
ncbi:hypothetical protein Ddc_14592 [Ditylenchus destructor]|nr:hypothetical protein Ddc_14592 [Ditylenchus destructor]